MGYTLTEFLEGSTKPQIQRGLTAILQNPNLTGNPRGVIDHKAVTDLVPAHEWIFDTDGFQLEMRQRIEDPTWEIFITGGNLPNEVTVPENWCDDDQISKVTFHETNFHTLNYKPNIETVFDHCKNTFTDITQFDLSASYVWVNDFISPLFGKINVQIPDDNEPSVLHFNSTQSKLTVSGYFGTLNISGRHTELTVEPFCHSTVNVIHTTSHKLALFQKTDEKVHFNIQNSCVNELETLEIRPSYYNINTTRLESYQLYSEQLRQGNETKPFLNISAAQGASNFNFQITYSDAKSSNYIAKIGHDDWQMQFSIAIQED